MRCFKAVIVFTSTAYVCIGYAHSQEADLILHSGKVVTVDEEFRITEAIAIKGDRILDVGGNAQITEEHAGGKTNWIDLEGKVVIPGLIDSHVHSVGASMYEFDHPIPEMETIADVLDYVRQRASTLEDGQWIRVRQVFITRLREQRYPTRAELDQAAPKNPVYFSTGPDASLNSLALELSGIDKDFKIPEGEQGRIERDPKTGEPNGIIRSASYLVNVGGTGTKSATPADRYKRLKQLLYDYNSVGITGITDGNASSEGVGLYKRLKENNELTCRVFLHRSLDPHQPIEQIAQQLAEYAADPLHQYDNMLWLRGIKVFLDGGMLTGSAYMRKPWGVSEIYSITDPAYQGMLYIQPEKLYQIAKLALEHELQPTAHAVGDGAVHAIINAYDHVNKLDFSTQEMRPCISHCNFMSAEAIENMQRLGIVANLQPAWLFLDGATLRKQFGDVRLQYFQPYRSIFEAGVTVGGGSDHMQKIGSYRSINPYNPFLGMWIALSRQPRWTDEPLHAEERITREQALRLYTINNAFLTFEEKEKGSLEAGKLADLVVLNTDILACPLDEVKDIQVDRTYLGGKLVYQAGNR